MNEYTTSQLICEYISWDRDKAARWGKEEGADLIFHGGFHENQLRMKEYAPVASDSLRQIGLCPGKRIDDMILMLRYCRPIIMGPEIGFGLFRCLSKLH